MATRDKWEVFHGLAKVRCISGVVQNAKELAENDHLNARGFLVDSKSERQESHGTWSGRPDVSVLRGPRTCDAPQIAEHSLEELAQPKKETKISTDLGRELLAT